MSKKRGPNRTSAVLATCPKCGLDSRLNWRKTAASPQTICLGLHPGNLRVVRVLFRCAVCLSMFDLGHCSEPYGRAPE